jgi:GDP-L-fucose synthase
VLPALIRRYVEARDSGVSQVVNWGTGSPRREFLHSDDLARACLTLLDRYDGDEHVNVGTGSDLTIRELAQMVARIVGFEGRTEWDSSKPDGTPRKVLDVSRMQALGWRPRVDLEVGVAQIVSDYEHGFAGRL